MNLTGIHHLIAPDFFARNGQQNLAQGFNPGLVIRSAGALKVAPEGVAGCNSKLAQYSNTPILHHSGVTSLLRTGVREVFVPKGLDEGSQAIYCLGYGYPIYWLPKSKNVLSTQSYRLYGTGRLLGRPRQ